MNVPGGPVRRGALVVVDQMNPDDAVGDVIPERRGILDAGIDEVDEVAPAPMSPVVVVPSP